MPLKKSNLQTLWRLRPRVLTVLLLLVLAALIALSNFTSEVRHLPGRPRSLGDIYRRAMYGWPLRWHWHNLACTMVTDVVANWEYSGGRLATNVACWTIMLAAPAAACEWWLRRHPPRWRWSLRMMLAGVALDGNDISADGLESLASIRHLKALHITERRIAEPAARATLKLDGREGLAVQGAEVDGFDRALRALRKSRPGIVIDSDAYANDRRFNREPPWETLRYYSYELPSPWERMESARLRSTWLPARFRAISSPAGAKAGSGMF